MDDNVRNRRPHGFNLVNSSSASHEQQFAPSSTSNGVYIFGAQIEALAYATSYIPTTSSTVTRAADNLYVPWTATTATFLAKTIGIAEAAGDERIIGSNTGDGPIVTGSGTSVETYQATAGGLSKSGISGGWTASHVSLAAGSPLGRVVTADGLTAASDANALFSATPATIYIGSNDGSSDFANGIYVQYGEWTIAATAAQAAALT